MKILFLSPNAAIWPHAAPEAQFMRSLRMRGHDVIYLSCGSVLSGHCTSMEAHGVQADAAANLKGRVCEACATNASLIRDQSGIPLLLLKEFSLPEDEGDVERYVSGVHSSSYEEFVFEGIEAGRIAAYEVILKFKKLSTTLEPDEWAYYLLQLKNCLRALIAFKRMWNAEKPDKVICYSPQYGVNGMCAEYATQSGAQVYFIEGSSSNSERYSALRMWDWQTHGLVNPALRHWQAARGLISVEDVRRIRGHFRELFSAQSFAVYSSKLDGSFTARSRYGVKEGCKIVLITLSSSDEAFSAMVIRRFPEDKVQSDVFRTQFDWVRHTIEFLGGRSDVFVIIRVHPRDFPNKRESVQSEQAERWRDLFSVLPSNIVANFPQEGVSLYDLLRDTDVMVTGWSATGVEAMALGIPVVTYDERLPSYPADIHYSGRSIAQYEANLEAAFNAPTGARVSADALRWLAVSFSMGAIRHRPLSNLRNRVVDMIPWSAARNGLGRMVEERAKKVDARGALDHTEDEKLGGIIETSSTSIFDYIVNHRPSALDDQPRLVEEALASEYAWLRSRLGADRGH